MQFDFTLILCSPKNWTEEFADNLFAEGCDDATLSNCEGTLAVDFTREGSDLESAIRSAVANIAAAGGVVDHVEIDANAPSREV